MTISNISDLNPDDSEMTVLSDEDLDNIQGGWLGSAIGGAALALGAYVAFTTEDERLVHRAGIKEGVKAGVKAAYRIYS